jgi:hypothetical protein
MMLGLFSSQIMSNADRGGNHDSGFRLPEIAEEDRIRVNTPKIRKHATKRRTNKLHDKRYKNPINIKAFLFSKKRERG